MVKIEKTQYIGDGSFPEEEEIDDDLEDEVDSLIREAEKIKSNTSGFNIKTVRGLPLVSLSFSSKSHRMP